VHSAKPAVRDGLARVSPFAHWSRTLYHHSSAGRRKRTWRPEGSGNRAFCKTSGARRTSKSLSRRPLVAYALSSFIGRKKEADMAARGERHVPGRSSWQDEKLRGWLGTLPARGIGVHPPRHFYFPPWQGTSTLLASWIARRGHGLHRRVREDRARLMSAWGSNPIRCSGTFEFEWSGESQRLTHLSPSSGAGFSLSSRYPSAPCHSAKELPDRIARHAASLLFSEEERSLTLMICTRR
jgi:hypothetical protein